MHDFTQYIQTFVAVMIDHEYKYFLQKSIKNNEKIFWVYLEDNPYGFNNIAFKKENNPKELDEFIKTYVDAKKNFDKAVNNKVDAFYNSLKWTLPMDSANTLEAFF